MNNLDTTCTIYMYTMSFASFKQWFFMRLTMTSLFVRYSQKQVRRPEPQCSVYGLLLKRFKDLGPIL